MLENPTLYFGIIGALGGFARALVGARKAYLRKKKFKLNYFLLTIVGAAIIGAIVGSVVGTNKMLALAAGYAGTDFLEGIAKSLRLVTLSQ